MNKKNFYYIIAGGLALIIIGLAIYFIVSANNVNKNSEYYTKKITLTRLEHNEPIKTVEIKSTNSINKLIEICKNISLEQDSKAKKLAIANDIKVDLNNGTFFCIQENLNDYCYMESQNSKLIIKMPDGLLNYINKNLPK